MQPLAPAGCSRSLAQTNLSTSLALSLLGADGKELSVHSDLDHPIELIIPRDPNLVIPAMTLQNVTALGTSPHQLIFNLHFINITTTLPVSVHLEMRSRDATLGYLLIYRFDSVPQLNSSVHLIDGWSPFCPSSEHLLYNDCLVHDLLVVCSQVRAVQECTRSSSTTNTH
jgi:hypothetical protein